MQSGTRRRLVVVLVVIVAVCLSSTDASRRRRKHEKRSGVSVIGAIEFDEHLNRKDYGGLDYTNQLFKKKFIDYESSDSHDSHEAIFDKSDISHA